MNFPRYAKYKASGVEWLGDVPEGWGVAPLKTVATHNDDTLDETTHPDTEILYVDISGVDALDGIKTKEPMLFSSAPSRARRRVKHGDTIVSTVRTYLRAIARVRNPEESLIVSTGFAVIRPQAALSADYVGYVLSAGYFIEQVIARSTGVSYPAINASELVRIPIALPPLPEQTAIAEFLDRETAKIDGLVADYRRLMELLKEKRQAVISHAVTKGLDPDAPMKPSGIEWLGDVPEHWRTGRLGYLVDLLVDGTHFSPPNGPEGDFKYITAKNIKEHGFDFTEITYVTAEEYSKIYPRCPVRRGDVLYIKDGATAGIAMVNPTEEQFSMLSSVALIRPIITILIPEFVAYHLNAGQFKNDALNKLVGGAMTRFTVDMIKRFVFAMPPIQEQESIITFLDIQTAKFDALTTDTQQAIDLLQERRTALISAAVTGQIDVRQQPRN